MVRYWTELINVPNICRHARKFLLHTLPERRCPQHREKDTLARLHQFTSKLRTGPADEQPAEQPAPAEEAGGPKASAREDIEEVSAERNLLQQIPQAQRAEK